MLGEPELPDLEAGDGRLFVCDRDGRYRVLPGVNGLSLMEILRAAELPVAATCGGAAACGTCHVYVGAEHLGVLGPISEPEQWQLDHLMHARDNSRLACQILWQEALFDGLTVELAPLE
ncbi:MAG: 2Fe-2S iron-sulfur cluster binding domain-containing protein [Proteobacteria bacterium]|nr:2Fe-2S iron-sulfur cluster binding domain-containing protein [Pseudomonadota bacterium]